MLFPQTQHISILKASTVLVRATYCPIWFDVWTGKVVKWIKESSLNVAPKLFRVLLQRLPSGKSIELHYFMSSCMVLISKEWISMEWRWRLLDDRYFAVFDPNVWPTRQGSINSTGVLCAETYLSLPTLLEAMSSEVLVILGDDRWNVGFLWLCNLWKIRFR